MGIYEHFKGRRYRVLGLAKHSETLEDMVVYQALHSDHELWLRPLKNFLERVEVNGKKIPRFRFLGK